MLRKDKKFRIKAEVSFQGSVLISVGGCVLATKVCFLDIFQFQLILFPSLISSIV